VKGTIDRDGYRYFYINRKGEPKRRVAEHVLIWEKAYGPTPEGMDVHHRDENKLNNVLENFELKPKAEHARMHRRARAGGYELRNGIWHKPCRTCLAVLPLDKFYNKANSKHHECKLCLCERTRMRKWNRTNVET
jgi:HNH endonuclease